MVCYEMMIITFQMLSFDISIYVRKTNISIREAKKWRLISEGNKTMKKDYNVKKRVFTL